MKLKGLFFVLLFFSYRIYASKVAVYPVSEIADSLKRNAGAVVRINHVTIDIHSIHKYTYTEEKVISVLNTSHEDQAEVTVWYDERLQNLKSFKAWIFDADGKEVKHLDKQDAADYSASPGFVLAGTQRVKYWDLKKLKPPFTIKYIYEKEVSGTFQLPDWVPAPETGISVEHATLLINCLNGPAINYKAFNLIDSNHNKQKLFWTIDGFCAVKKTEFAPPTLTSLPQVLLMAKEFEIYGYTGSAENWNNIGQFMNTLMKDREELSTIDDSRLNSIIALKTDPKEKVRLLYKYLQSNFRYVCISLGIGGWQPQEASFTLQKKYGDCKALSMIMKALLKKAGIESCITLITAGNGNRIELNPDFAHSYFNHAILCVPFANDTVWLECTSPVSPFNYLGNFTSNRRALMIYNGGARVIKTPSYNEDYNISRSTSFIKLNPDNTVSIKTSMAKESELQDDLRVIIDQKDAKNIELAIYNSVHLKNTTINTYSVTEVGQDKPRILFTLDLKDESTVRKSDTRLFIKTDLYNPITSIPEKNENRSQQVVIKAGFTQSDTLIYSLPAGYTPESFKAEDDKQFTNQFGYANRRLNYNNETNELTLIRTFCLKQATYPANQYQALRDFLLKSQKQCCPELVLKKQG